MIMADRFIVTSTRRPPNHDSGSWSSHEDLADAVKTARRVNGKVWFVDPADDRLTMKEVAWK